MTLWTLIGLKEGKATLSWPKNKDDHGQENVLGMPRFNPDKCLDNCSRCVSACLPKAITRDKDNQLQVDYGACINCQLCTEVCPTGAMSKSNDWDFGVKKREDLIFQKKHSIEESETTLNKSFQRSLHIRHVDVGSCNGCESELLGSHNSVLLETYAAMPNPCFVMAVGTCAVSGGIAAGGVCHHGLENILPVDVYLPGCPPNPAAILSALLMFLNRRQQSVHGGQCHDSL